MQQTKSCVNRMLPETSPSRVHASCSLRGRGQWGGGGVASCSLHAPPAPITVGSGNVAAMEPEALSCFLGAGGAMTPGMAPAGEGEQSRAQDQGRGGKRDASPGAATLQP